VHGRIILKWILQNIIRRCGLGLSDLEHGPVTGSCEHRNEALCSTKGSEFFDPVRGYQFLKNEFAIWS
jgi:hypothetical protein